MLASLLTSGGRTPTNKEQDERLDPDRCSARPDRKRVPMPNGFMEQGVQLPLLIVGWIALGLFVLALIAFALEILVGLDDVGTLGVIFFGGLSALMAIFWVVLMVPFDGKYQHYYEVHGRVTEVSNVLSDADGDLTRQPVATIAGLDRPVVIDDPRAVSLKDRDVTLRCTIEWHYNAADSYDCKIADYGTAVAR